MKTMTSKRAIFARASDGKTHLQLLHRVATVAAAASNNNRSATSDDRHGGREDDDDDDDASDISLVFIV